MSLFSGGGKDGDDYAVTQNTPYGGAQQSLITNPNQLAQIDSGNAQFTQYMRELDPWKAHGESFWDVMEQHVLPLFAAGAAVGAAVYGIAGAIGAGAAGAGSAAAAGGAEAAGVAGGLGSAAGAAGAAEAAGGLGSMIGVAGGAPAVVSIGAPAAAAAGTGAGLGGLAAGGAALGLGGMMAGGAPTGAPTPQPAPDGMQQVVIGPPGAATSAGVGAGAPLALGGAAVAGGLLSTNPEALQQLPNVNGAAPTSNIPPPIGPGNIPSTLPIPPFGVPSVNGAQPTTPGASNVPPTGTGGLGNLGNILGGLLGGNVDRIKADQDSEWWKSQIDTLMGMYKPGTPEAEQMRQKMEAQDAMTGRRSQYGVRSVNLATNLAEKRAGIMTSAGYQNMANAYRQRSSQDLAGLFGAVGANGGLGNTVTGIVNGLGGLFGGN